MFEHVLKGLPRLGSGIEVNALVKVRLLLLKIKNDQRHEMHIVKEINSVLAFSWAILLVQIIGEIKKKIH